MATTINQWFEEQSQRTPERIAISCGDDQLSYRQLSAISNTLAQHLLATNFGRESRIGICLNRSTDLVIGILGILKAGAAYVPLDHAYPVERLSYIVQDAGIETIICDNETRLCFIDSDIKLNLISLSEITRLSADSDPTSLPVEISSEHAAYVIYTSGSTGQPKGCVVTHGNVVRLFSSTESLFEFNQTDVWTLFHSFAFDFSVWEIWGALFYGGRLVVVPSAISRAPDEFLDLLIREEVTVLNQTPSAFLHLIEAESSRSHQTNSLRLRYIIFGGEGLDPRSLRNWVERHSIDHPQLINMYGITETTVHVTYRRITLDDIHRGGSPIGHPLADLQVYLLNAKGEPVAEGVPGEIYVGGAGLARGYLNRPELTAERFVTPPFDGCPSDRLYRSGDLARRNIDGSFEFLGRIDNQVKIRGHRIELGEIEAAIRQLEFVTQVAVIARDEGTVGKILVAYIVVQTGTKLDAAIMRQSLAVKLPPYMVPSFYVELETLPLTINGKLDVKALPLPQSHALQRERSIVRPRNPVEETIASAWISILNIQPISIDDNFFELGGHSLLAMRLVSIIGKQLNCNLLVKWVFENPTIQQLAQKLTEVKDNDGPLQSIPLIDRRQPIPLSFGQHAMWLVQALLPDAATYNQPIAIHLKGRIDRALVDHCIEQIARRHESLRTAFVQSGETLIQHICEPAEFAVNRRDISLHQPTVEQQQLALQAALVDEARRPFDLAVAPLWRVLWIELAVDELVLELTFHHSIIDEWSVRTFCHELSTLYRTAGDRQAASLQELPIQYADYAVWQLARQTTAEWEQSLVYWKEQLADLPPALELPADRVRPTQPSGQGAIYEFRLSSPLTNRLRQLARDESATLFTLMLSAFNVWLARHTGQTDLIVGTPLADRDRPEVQSLIGYFLNTLPIRTRLEENQTFRGVLRQIHQTFWDAYSHAGIPFERLVELAVKDREPGRHPIYQVMFVLLEESVEELQLRDATGHLLSAATGTSKNDLRLDIQATGDEWICRLEYATELFSAQTVARMADHFTEILQSIANEADIPIDQLNLIGKNERHKILVEWNQTERDYPRDKCLHQHFEEQVQRTPYAVAVEFEEQTLSYSELNARANQLANYLRAQGVRPDMLVGVYATRSLEMVVSLFGILKAGGAYVPIDPEYPAKRVSYMLADSGVTVLLTQSHLVTSLPDHSATVFCLDADWKQISSLSDLNSQTEVTPSNLAYMIYTSGSTGKPKGAMNTHLGIVNQLKWMQEQYELRPTDVVLQKTPFSFDVSVWEFFWPLLNGARLCVAKPGGHRDADYLVRSIQAHCVTVSVFVPSMLQLFLEHSGVELCTTLRHVICIGEALSADLRDRFFTRLDVPLHNLYGPAEAAVSVTHWTCHRDQTLPVVPIGRPVANTQCYILDQHHEPVPIGVSGELYLGGVQIGRGYHNQPELTSQKFIRDPFQSDPNARLYKTGDICRFLSDGNIQFLGRIDNQVKIRGFRIELDEIESFLVSHPGVSHCVISTDENEHGEKSVGAYIVPAEQSVLTIGSLRKWLADRLPEYMIPSRFFSVAAIPLSPNGKVDRHALKTLISLEFETGTEYRPPRTSLEQILADAWKSVLGIERISATDNFFELGAHSLLAMRLVSIVGKHLNCNLLVKWVFEHPTVEQLAQKLIEVKDNDGQLQSIPLVDRSQPLPLSFGQHAMWLVQALLPDAATYNQPIAVHLKGRIDRALVDHSIEQVARRHELLRTAFVQSGETLVQQICEPAEFEVNRRKIALHRPTPEQQQLALQAVLIDEARRPFDLAVAPLWRVLWIELADDELVLQLTFHHSIIDEWSVRTFCHELSALYRTAGDLQAASLPELPIQFADYAVWQRARQTTVEWEQSLAYWKEQLADLPTALELPSDRVRLIQPSGKGAIHEFRLTSPLTSQLRQLARDESATLFTLMLTAFNAWLARQTGQTDIIVGTPLADRDRPEVQSLIGYFLNTLPIRTRLEENHKFRRVLRQIHQTLMDAYKHAEIPFEQLVELAVKVREFGRHPIYQVMFVLLDDPVEDLQFGNVFGRPFWPDTGTSKNDLRLEIQANGDEWDCQIEYATDLFTQPLIERFASHFQSLLEEITTDPEASIHSLPFMTKSETQQVLKNWNQTSVSFSEFRTIHEFFERQVELTPESDAIVFNRERLSYRELNERANAIADQLISLGTKPDSLIGLFAERSLETMVGLLGILKAGAAYVPLDPSYPETRLRSIIQDAQIDVIVTQEHLAGQLMDGDFHRVILGESGSGNSPVVENPPHAAGPNHLAYVLFTSGSTGRPKGVAMEHRALTNLIQWQIHQNPAGEHFRTLQFASLGFDVSFQEIFSTWCSGGTLVLIDENTRRDMSLFFKYIESEQLERIFVPFVVLQQFIEASEDYLQKELSLREVVTAGEQLRITPQLVRFFENHPGCRLVNQYGPTEAHVVTSYRLEGSPLDWPLLPPIGRPIANIHVYVLDQHLQPLSIGMPGELYLGGVGVARGYLHQPELTAEKFLPDPFSNRPGSRLYRTGDKVRWNADGQLEFLGRIDQQVKFRGYRIELGEIEAVLNRAPQVAQTLVMLREDHPGEKRLVAYIVPTDENTNPATEQMRGFLQNQLPEYMVPSIFVVLPELPLTVNGKVDRKALPIPNYDELSHGTRRHLAPGTPLEQLLADAWKRVLKIERVSVEDNFFELGGHSLLAMKLVSTVGNQLNREMLVKWVFENPTIRQFAQKINGLDHDQGQLQAIPLVDRKQLLPLSFGQQAMWLVQELLPNAATYNQPIAIHLNGQIDRPLVDHCIEQIACRHESLRTAFVQSGGTLVQQICEPADFVMNRHQLTLRHEPIELQDHALRLAIFDEVRRPFDLAVAPLWRVLWIELADDDQVLVITFHHSIVDEWSTQNFCRELSALYRTEGDFQTASLPELPIQYADYAIWQRARQATAEWEQSLAYWKEQLADLPPALELPSDRLLPIEPSGHGAIHEFRLSASLTSQLRQLARAESTTHFSLMLAAFHVWLLRHTGQTDLIVGTPLADRGRPEVQPLIGYFLNTLPIRARLDGRLNFRKVLRQVHQTFWDAYTHAEIPFERLVELAVKEREPGRNPIYQVMFVLLEQAVEGLRFGDTIGQPVWAATGTRKNDLTLDIQTIGEEWICRLEYATDLFSAGAVARMADHFTELLRSIVKDADAPIGQLNLIGNDERQKILVEWNQTKRDYSRDQCLHQLFEEQVQRTPNAIAVEFEGESLTYRVLNARANQLASYLRAQGVQPEMLVGVYVVRSLEMVVSLFGILKAGGAYVPIDPEYPAERVSYMLSDSNVTVLLTQSHLVASLPDHSATVFCVDADWKQISSLSDGNPETEVTTSNLAYMIYTSGSTGKPKGAMNTHRGIVNRLLWMQEQYDLRPSDVVMQKTPFSFDVSVWEFFWPLLNGARLGVAKPGGHRDADYLVRLIRANGVTVLHFVPSMLRLFLESNGVEACTSLRYVICSGEALPADLRDRFFTRLDIPLHNLYGPTEAAVDATHWTCQRDQTLPFVPIGRPVANTQCYILDQHLQPVPIGVSSELYLGGVQVGRGYHNQPELTSQKFIRDPFQSDPDARLYKTGDLCRFLDDGNIEFLGRIDNQVKIRGFRIELDEIESVLGSHPDVARCVVNTEENEPGEKTLTAFLVPAGNTVLSVGSLRKWLAQRLPDYMIPSRFFSITAIPLSPNGKVDRRVLKESSAVELETGVAYRPPRTNIEHKLAEIWQSVLGRELIGLDDHFLDLGGYSLRAAVICGQIAQTLDVSIPLRWIFEYPTVEALARKIESDNTRLVKTSQIQRADRNSPLPMSPGQQAMWLLDQLLPDAATYNLSFGWRIHGKLDRARVQQVLQVIVERHEVLRTALLKQDGDLIQRVISPIDLLLPWAERDLRDLHGNQQAEAIEELLVAEANHPFELDQAPLWRTLWIELADDDQAVVFTFHHSICDKWSIRLFVQEFSSLYSIDGNLERANLPTLPIQYADYAYWQHQLLTGDDRERLVAYWKEQLADLPPALELPSDRIPPKQPTGRGEIHEFRLDHTVVTGLRQLANEERMTLFTILLAGFQVWLYRYTGQTDLIVGTPLADRRRPEVQSLIGYFLNMLPIRSRIESNRSFRDVLRQVHQTIWNAFSHADLPFEQMVELAVKQREPGRNPIYQVMFVLLEESVGDLRLGSLYAVPLNVPTRTSKNDLTLDIQTTGDQWICRLEYATDLLSSEAVARMADHFTQLLRSIVKDADTPIGQLNLMGQGERHRILVEWNQTRREYPRDKCIHRLFEEQVQRTPKAVAVEFEGQSVTYGELNARANQLAHSLQKLGVRPETRVGICVDRSLEMVVGLLAILKVGGAYVPLDPLYPAERLNFMVADTGITLILTQRHLESRWQNAKLQLIMLDAEHAAYSNEPDGNLNLQQSSESSAYVIYTSGSTGTPKGVEVVHRGIVRLVCGANYVQLDESQSVLQLAVLSFDASTFEIWGPLLHGGRCILAPAQFPDPDELHRILRQGKVRTLWLTTSLFNALVDGHVDVLNGIEQLLVGGEALSVPHIRRAQQALGNQTQIINGYGPTESTTFACCFRLPAIIPENWQSIPIGRPISNTTAYVLDANRELVPIGVTGELYLGGDGLARGYLNQPELTSEKFLPDPLSDQPNAWMYRTGDLVRWRDDGTIEFLGRRDRQIKLRGFRIETGEIENVLLLHSAIRHAIVVLREDRPGDKRLVAYLVPQENQSENFVNELRQYLQDKLPDYMIPSSWVTLTNLPLTPNGKVDKPALPRPVISAHDRQHTFVPPRTAMEEMLASAWSSVLGIDQISVHDNFFELGGHSLLAVRVVDAIKSASGIMIKVADLFRHATVAELAESLSETTRTPEDANHKHYLESIRPGSRDTHLVIVGAKLRVPVEMLPPEIPVWWLKLDGLHVWPPQYLDLPTQAAIHVQEMLNVIPSGTILLCGHSYGGLLAIEIARQLTLVEKHAIKLILLEPTIPPDPDVSIIKRAAQKVRHYKKRIRLRLVQELAVGLHKRTVGKLNRMMIRARQSVDQKISPDDRWRYMEPFLFEHVRAYQLPDSIEHDVHLIKTEFYGPEDLEALNQIIKGAFSVYDASDSLDHLDIADARHSAVWMSIVQQLIAEQSNLPAV